MYKKDNFIIVRVSEQLKKQIVKLAKKSKQSISDYLRDKLEKLNA